MSIGLSVLLMLIHTCRKYIIILHKKRWHCLTYFSVILLSGRRWVWRRGVCCKRWLYSLWPDGQIGLFCYRHGPAQTGMCISTVRSIMIWAMTISFFLKFCFYKLDSRTGFFHSNDSLVHLSQYLLGLHIVSSSQTTTGETKVWI